MHTKFDFSTAVEEENKRRIMTRGRLALLAITLVVAVATTFAQLPGGTLDPLTIPKYVDPLPIPPAMPQTANEALSGVDYYEIAIRQFEQQVLSTGLPKTKVWSYGSANHPATFHYPAFTIEATVDKPVRVKWINQLVDNDGNFLPHLVPVDQTLHWANPAGDCMEGAKRSDCRGKSQASYAGPVPAIVHVHGAHVNPDSDGYPQAWYLPAANDIDCIGATGYPRTADTGDDYFCRGSNFGQISGAPDDPGVALFEYRNDQRATTLWYHDHSLGMTRANVYAGPAGFYMLRGGTDDLPSAVPGGLPGGAYEIPIVIQDRSFNSDGSLFYPDSRTFFDGFEGPYIGDDEHDSDVAPILNPEFFGNTMVVNGKTWPFLNVEPRKYRFRFLNGSDSRFLILKLSDKKTDFTQIGSDGGFLPAPVVLDELLVGPAERADVIVDFSNFAPGDTITLLNVGPDEPFGGRFPASLRADPTTTGQVMQFNVVDLTATDTSAIPALPSLTPVGEADNVRQVSLNELDSSLVCLSRSGEYNPSAIPPDCGHGFPAGPVAARLGTIDPLTGLGVPLMWEDAITEKPALGSVEEWEISNFTADAHPIHIHMVMFQVIDRQPFGKNARAPEAWESGYKDTVIAYPGEITRVRALYDIPGLFVWHCHILSHEDNEMMRAYQVE
jgi:FtsP/CotA-like multicopper oxidase with cupredoxin domain